MRERMGTSKFLVYTTPASQMQMRITCAAALALFLGFIVAIFLRRQMVYPGMLFVPVSSALLMMADWITAALLLAQARAMRASPLAVLAAGFFATGLLILFRLLFIRGSLVPAPDNIPLFFYLASHAALPLAVIANALLARASDQPVFPATPRHPGTRFVAGAVILAGSLILAAATIETPLQLTSPIFLGSAFVLLLTICALFMLGLRLRSELDLWLLLALWGWFLEVVLIALDSRADTLAWYGARLLGLASGLFVLFTLIGESSRLYGQSVQLLDDQDHERERRFLVREAIAASLAHELRQPLSAILLNAEAARKYLESNSGDMAGTLDDIITCSLRASDIMRSTRAMLAGQASEKRPADLEVLLRRTVDMVSAKARARKVSITLVMEGTLKPVLVNSVQIQQAFLNLFQNAIEALAG